MAGRGQNFFREKQREIREQVNSASPDFERTYTQANFYWRFLYMNYVNDEAEEENIPNYREIWRDRLYAYIDELIEKKIGSGTIYDDRQDEPNEPYDYYEKIEDGELDEGIPDRSPRFGIPIEQAGESNLLERIAGLRGNLFFEIDDLEDYIKNFASYVVAIRANADGTFQIWVEGE